MRPKRCLAREIGNPLTMFHGKGADRNVKWSMFRIILFGLFVGFLAHWPPAPWGMWEWATLATIALAITVDTMLALVPVREGMMALAAMFGAAVSKRVSTSTVVTTKEEKVEGAPTPVAAVGADAPHEWAVGNPDDGLI